MRVRDERGFSFWMIIASIVGLFALLWVIMYLMDNGSPPDPVANPECPHSYNELALSAEITNIPEFHDCQKLIEQDGKAYGTLAGVFARFQLDSLLIPIVYNDAIVSPTEPITAPVGIAVPAGSLPGVRVTSVTQLAVLDRTLRANSVAVGEVISWNGAYDPLGIAQGTSCLFIVRVARAAGAPYSYRGLMVNVPSDQACLGSAPADGGKWLKVTHLPPGGVAYPPVARWDWDEANKRQFIGILCQPDWCEAGDETTVPSSPRDVAMGTQDQEIPWEQKGRYDEQRLAIADGAGLVPSTVLATASPAPGLGSYARQSFYGGWRAVASTVLPQAIPAYATKLNFGPGSVPGVTNQVSVCAGSRVTCLGLIRAFMTMFTVRCWKSEDEDPKNWWARIVSSDGTTAYRCVTRRIHPGVNPPAAARWRWKMNDEGLWTRCGEGCCEVQEE